MISEEVLLSESCFVVVLWSRNCRGPRALSGMNFDHEPRANINAVALMKGGRWEAFVFSTILGAS